MKLYSLNATLSFKQTKQIIQEFNYHVPNKNILIALVFVFFSFELKQFSLYSLYIILSFK